MAHRSRLHVFACFALFAALAGCSTTATETFYVGRFDPLNQLPQELYRFRVYGEGSWYHDMQYASGWLPAKVVDPLETTLYVEKNRSGVRGAATGETATPADKTHVEAYRTMRLFGPEAFVEVPKHLRFCVVMSADPNKFFQAAKLLAGGSLADEATLLRQVDEYRLKGGDEYVDLDRKLEDVNKPEEAKK